MSKRTRVVILIAILCACLVPAFAPALRTLAQGQDETLTLDSATGWSKSTSFATQTNTIYEITLSGVYQWGDFTHEISDPFWSQTAPGGGFVNTSCGWGGIIQCPGAQQPYNPAHTYTVQRTGTGAAFSFIWEDGNNSNNVGSLTVRVRAVGVVQDGGPDLAVSCAELGDSANMSDWLYSNGAVYEAGTGAHMVGDTASASLQKVPDAAAQYFIEVSYLVEAAPTSTTLKLEWGTAVFEIALAELGYFTYTTPESTFSPGANLKITRVGGGTTDYGIYVQSVCIVRVDQGVTLTIDDTVYTCEKCADPTSLIDIIGIINWLLCQLKNFLLCVIGEMLRQMIFAFQMLLSGEFSFFDFIAETIQASVGWIFDSTIKIIVDLGGSNVKNIVDNIAGGALNLLFGVDNNGAREGGLLGSLNVLASAAQDLPNVLRNEISLIASAMNGAQDLFGIVRGLIDTFFASIRIFLSLAPILIQALSDGIAVEAAPVLGAPICSQPSSLLYPVCLGFYVLDNTLMSTFATRALLLLCAGFMTINTFVWSLNRLRRSFA
jgi:hypothetical protein